MIENRFLKHFVNLSVISVELSKFSNALQLTKVAHLVVWRK